MYVCECRLCDRLVAATSLISQCSMPALNRVSNVKCHFSSIICEYCVKVCIACLKCPFSWVFIKPCCVTALAALHDPAHSTQLMDFNKDGVFFNDKTKRNELLQVRHFQSPITPEITSKRMRYNRTDTSTAQVHHTPLLNGCDTTTQTRRQTYTQTDIYIYVQ